MGSGAFHSCRIVVVTDKTITIPKKSIAILQGVNVIKKLCWHTVIAETDKLIVVILVGGHIEIFCVKTVSHTFKLSLVQVGNLYQKDQAKQTLVA